MIAHSNEQIKKPVPPINTSTLNQALALNSQSPPSLHLPLHRSTPLKRPPAPYNQRQIMRPKFRIAIRRVRVRVPRAGQDRRALDPRLQALFPEGEPFELGEGVFFRRAVEEGVLQQGLERGGVEDCALDCPTTGSTVFVFSAFELPGVAAFVVQQPRVVVAFVEVFEDGGEDFGEVVGQVDAFGGGFEKLATADGGEEGGGGKDVFVGGEEALFGADAEGDYRGG